MISDIIDENFIIDSLDYYINLQKSLLGFETKWKYWFKKRKFKKYIVKPSPYFSLYNKLFSFSILHEFLSILINKTKNKEWFLCMNVQYLIY